MIFELPFETPSKKNSRINTRSGRSFPNKKYTEWHKTASFYIKTHYQLCRFEEPVKVKMEFTHGTLRRSDSDNKVSSILDLLVDMGILIDDNWQIVQKIEVWNDYAKNCSKCRVEIETIENFKEPTGKRPEGISQAN